MPPVSSSPPTSDLLRDARPEDGARIGALYELYAYEFSAILGLDVGDDGRFVTPSLDAYWTDPRRHAFLFRVEERLGGFALVHQGSRLADDASVWDMAEFFVMRKYRLRGIGKRAAHGLFDRFRGPWEVRERAGNDGATAFWRRAIGGYTGGVLEDVVWDDARWRGPVQRFTSAR